MSPENAYQLHNFEHRNGLRLEFVSACPGIPLESIVYPGSRAVERHGCSLTGAEQSGRTGNPESPIPLKSSCNLKVYSLFKGYWALWEGRLLGLDGLGVGGFETGRQAEDFGMWNWGLPSGSNLTLPGEPNTP